MSVLGILVLVLAAVFLLAVSYLDVALVKLPEKVRPASVAKRVEAWDKDENLALLHALDGLHSSSCDSITMAESR